MSSANSIKVVARFRPQNRVEIESGGQPIVRFDGNDTCTIDVSVFSPCAGYRHRPGSVVLPIYMQCIYAATILLLFAYAP